MQQWPLKALIPSTLFSKVSCFQNTIIFWQSVCFMQLKTLAICKYKLDNGKHCPKILPSCKPPKPSETSKAAQKKTVFSLQGIGCSYNPGSSFKGQNFAWLLQYWVSADRKETVATTTDFSSVRSIWIHLPCAISWGFLEKELMKWLPSIPLSAEWKVKYLKGQFSFLCT